MMTAVLAQAGRGLHGRYAPWAHPDYASFSDQHKELLAHARLFSEVMHGAALSYNVQLARLRNHDDLVAEHQANFDE